MEGELEKVQNYEDIINMPHHVSKTHPQMPITGRAAQFSPFAALTGYDAEIRETQRLTDERTDMDESVMADINIRLLAIKEQLAYRKMPEITVTYFVPDKKKEGGAYVTATGVVKKVDEYRRLLVMQDGQEIPMEEITEITEV